MTPAPEDFERANRQRADHGFKPWRPGVPLKDALGNEIVFEENGMRYTVPEVRGDSHVRVLMYDRRFTGPFNRVEARAPSEIEAHVVASLFAARRAIGNLRIVDKRAEGSWHTITYEHGESLD